MTALQAGGWLGERQTVARREVVYMPRFSITLVYSVEAPSKYLARVRLGEALREGIADGVSLEYESVFLDPLGWKHGSETSGDPGSPKLWWKAWAEEVRDQLLGPKKARQQPAGKKSWS